jgi:hypothetical protein
MKRAIATLALSLLPAGAFADLVFEHGGHTYKLVETPATWDDARAAAEAMNLGGQPGYLARIDSAAENTALLEAALNHLSEEQLAESRANDESGAAFIWLGGSDTAQEGRWAWVNNDEQFWAGDFNGSPVQGRFANWGIQPDNADGGEDSLAIGLGDWPEPFYDLGATGQWNDLKANNTLFYFVEFESKSDLKLGIEEPVRGAVYSGIRMVRGWAVSTDGIDKIEVFVDDEHLFDLPHGGPHSNAGKRFPDIEGSDQAGYATPLNYSALTPGEHTLMVRVTDKAGSVTERESNFLTTRFHKPFISNSGAVDLGWTVTDGLFDRIKIQYAYIDGMPYRITLKWNTVTQSFDIIEINPQ